MEVHRWARRRPGDADAGRFAREAERRARRRLHRALRAAVRDPHAPGLDIRRTTTATAPTGSSDRNPSDRS
ncbi:hypothetical protein ACFQZ4_14090 [Catellatospora coxensis]